MQNCSLLRKNRKRGFDVWLLRWSDKSTSGKRIYRKRVIGTGVVRPGSIGQICRETWRRGLSQLPSSGPLVAIKMHSIGLEKVSSPPRWRLSIKGA